MSIFLGPKYTLRGTFDVYRQRNEQFLRIHRKRYVTVNVVLNINTATPRNLPRPGVSKYITHSTKESALRFKETLLPGAHKLLIAFAVVPFCFYLANFRDS